MKIKKRDPTLRATQVQKQFICGFFKFVTCSSVLEGRKQNPLLMARLCPEIYEVEGRRQKHHDQTDHCGSPVHEAAKLYRVGGKKLPDKLAVPRRFQFCRRNIPISSSLSGIPSSFQVFHDLEK